MTWQNLDRYEVGVYWPRDDSYGIPEVVNDLQQASAAIERLNRSGYGVGSSHPSEIHVRRVRVDVVPLDQIPMTFTHFRCEDCGFESEITESGIARHRKDCKTGTTVPTRKRK